MGARCTHRHVNVQTSALMGARCTHMHVNAQISALMGALCTHMRVNAQTSGLMAAQCTHMCVNAQTSAFACMCLFGYDVQEGVTGTDSEWNPCLLKLSGYTECA